MKKISLIILFIFSLAFQANAGDSGDQSLEIAIDLFNKMRRNISGRNTLYGYLSDDKWREVEW